MANVIANLTVVTSRLLIALALTAALLGCARKPDPPLKSREFTALSTDEQMKVAGDAFLSAQDLQLYKRVRDIPESCRDAFAGHDTDNQLYMSDPDQEYQGSQEEPDPKYPRQRLIYAGSDSTVCYIYYEQLGTDGVKYHLTLFHMGPPVTITYHGIDSKGIYPELERLRVALNYRQFMRMTGYERFDSERPRPKPRSTYSRRANGSHDPFKR
jgi:hypothetical protein